MKFNFIKEKDYTHEEDRRMKLINTASGIVAAVFLATTLHGFVGLHVDDSYENVTIGGTSSSEIINNGNYYQTTSTYYEPIEITKHDFYEKEIQAGLYGFGITLLTRGFVKKNIRKGNR